MSIGSIGAANSTTYTSCEIDGQDVQVASSADAEMSYSGGLSLETNSDSIEINLSSFDQMDTSGGGGMSRSQPDGNLSKTEVESHFNVSITDTEWTKYAGEDGLLSQDDLKNQLQTYQTGYTGSYSLSTEGSGPIKLEDVAKADINNDGKINKLDTVKTPLKQN